MTYLLLHRFFLLLDPVRHWCSLLHFFHFIHHILRLQNFNLVLFFFFLIPVFLFNIWFCSYIDFFLNFIELPVFSCRSLSFLKITILNSFTGNNCNSLFLGRGVSYCKITVFLHSVIFFDFSCSLRVLHCCLCIWRSSHLLQSLTHCF